MSSSNSGYQAPGGGSGAGSHHTRGRYPSHHRGANVGSGLTNTRGRGMGRGRGRGGIGSQQPGDRYDSNDHSDKPTSSGFHHSTRGSSRGGGPSPGSRNPGDHHHQAGGTGGIGGGMGKPGHLVSIKATVPTPVSNTSWRVFYAMPQNSRQEVGPSGDKIPGPFSPPLRPSTPEQAASAPRNPQDVLRKQNETHMMKQRVQQLLQQAANSPAGSMGTYVGKLSQSNNNLIPVLPRLEA
ncbi:hypothetical protein BX661DRAFT_175625 [Kickxella alabastrina]|uniref:uncharacterized protein n=1 Tax=Kickxella alabastrina TaxID=61397 RepID=UPI002220C0EF|nr:uncharacterized protein BX661DRAFT_175625 [Kickxella alabastrina]KAI7834836.1 hypothetical protein BX661DRAFT_175625 [Kickxella alabastrina]KAJ1947139.1 hypothetical protein GGF37_000660 [Kickxella alabastrina]